MRGFSAATAATLVLCSSADAVAAGSQITRTVPAGKTTVVMNYRPRNRFCESTAAVATLVAKPQHGTVSHHSESTTMPAGRCYGKPTVGFVVTYTPGPGFRGVDHFIIEVKNPGAGVHRLDGFAIIVE